mgnify:CR=1 FL=1
MKKNIKSKNKRNENKKIFDRLYRKLEEDFKILKLEREKNDKNLRAYHNHI